MKKNIHRSWGTVAVGLGVWELAAFVGKFPTISRTCWTIKKKHGRKADLIPITFCILLTRHLTNPKE